MLNQFLLILALPLHRFESFSLILLFEKYPSYISPCCIACNGCILLICKPDKVAPIKPIITKTPVNCKLVAIGKCNGMPSGATIENSCVYPLDKANATIVIIIIYVDIILNNSLVFTTTAYKI